MLRQDVQAPAVRPVAVPRPRSPVPWLVAAVVVLAIAVVALGAMLLQPSLTTTPGETLGNRVAAAWNVFNEEEIRALYAEDAVLRTNISAEPTASGIDEIVDTARYAGLTVEWIGELGERGHLVWGLTHVSSTYDVSGSDEITVFYVEDGKITQQWVVWDELE
jgi:hypothetical protein